MPINRRIDAMFALHRSSEASKRLETIPGIGILGATTIATIVTDPNMFRSGRDFAAWLRTGKVARIHKRAGNMA